LSGGRIAPIPTGPAAGPRSTPRYGACDWHFDRRSIEPPPVAAGEVTLRLHGQLDEEDLLCLRASLEPEALDQLDQTPPGQRPFYELAWAVHHRIASVLEKTRLSPAVPPEAVHAMGRGPLAAGGSYYYADLVAEGLRMGGGDPSGCERALDFGCSSGRVVRVLAAAYPTVEWHGCDPNEPAIAWARANLPGIGFQVSPTVPPMSSQDDHFDAVFAISIWSHFSERAAKAWLAEMGRLVRPEGHLILTTHGFQSIAHYARTGQMSSDHIEQAARGLYEQGFWFGDWFRGSDHGVSKENWGMAFLSPEWLLINAPPDWAVVGFQPGRAEGNQDLYVLERRPYSRRPSGPQDVVGDR
jgi:SAM-dependent methyltransferase